MLIVSETTVAINMVAVIQNPFAVQTVLGALPKTRQSNVLLFVLSPYEYHIFLTYIRKHG